MNDRDPITEWSDAIKSRVGNAVAVCFILAFICCLVAPAFAPTIKSQLKKYYSIEYDDFDAKANKDMERITPTLWTMCIIAWIIVIFCHVAKN